MLSKKLLISQRKFTDLIIPRLDSTEMFSNQKEKENHQATPSKQVQKGVNSLGGKRTAERTRRIN
jgi:hypothetical protein